MVGLRMRRLGNRKLKIHYERRWFELRTQIPISRLYRRIVRLLWLLKWEMRKCVLEMYPHSRSSRISLSPLFVTSCVVCLWWLIEGYDFAMDACGTSTSTGREKYSYWREHGAYSECRCRTCEIWDVGWGVQSEGKITWIAFNILTSIRFRPGVYREMDLELSWRWGIALHFDIYWNRKCYQHICKDEHG